MAKIIVIGSGIVGLATARELALAGHAVHILEKEYSIAKHQTGNNSGVIHSGLYYTPGSQKAIMGVAGQKSMLEFAKDRGVAYEQTGKLIVATNSKQLSELAKLEEKAKLNGVKVKRLTPRESVDYEPHVRSLGSLFVESTGIIDYPGVSKELLSEFEELDGEITFGTKVLGGHQDADGIVVQTSMRDYKADYVVNCAGLHSDRIAKSFNIDPEVQIVPFRGEYYELKPELDYLVKGLIYPVPDPRFPFLGVHLTKMIHGGVHAGPNAVLALAREGYNWRTFNKRDFKESLSWRGFQKLAAKNMIPGAHEMMRSFSKTLFAKSLAELVPGITKNDITKSAAGVRAQALKNDGKLVDDFLMKEDKRQLHVLNAPSPAATGSLEIGKAIALRVEKALKA